jgi:hypothetical protein
VSQTPSSSIAVLFQALPPSVIDGLRKEAKPGGYSDELAWLRTVDRTVSHEREAVSGSICMLDR